MKYIELGVGNKWFVRTETELSDGSEYEVKGIVGPIKCLSLYIRVWIRTYVVIVDTKEGLKFLKKNRKGFKFIIGVVSQ
ncbi:DUF3977 family protein [Pseudalkalibacillus berkeleyi]|uniref:DUF3977 family protein n=1 Tax=Pseudalkalibacillus berkeleyi TaxID=1069813 RepID=A0ABS9H1P6_9BACL|nr:DUF3977 family protein [Pseudalkalibacillus berkeleyi]MCF6137826.1 DUF3977 family protein [Pseudalkalibacillus berkeleyi]